MKLRGIPALLAATLLAVVAPLRAQTPPRNHSLHSLTQFSDSLRELSTKISPSVVQIIGTGYGIETDEQHTGAGVLSRQRNTGSGAIVSDDGYIMTNAHVVEGARTIHVVLNQRRKGEASLFDAKLIGVDRLLDLALLKIEATGLTPLRLGNSLDVEQGELVLAFGSPLGMDNSVTMGVVSAPARQLNEDDPRIYIQTDAPINPGNSGGPLVDVKGRLVGINTFIFSQSGGSEGIGFAIPSNVIRYVYVSLRRDGHVHHAQIGINARTITQPLATAFNLEPEKGVLVEDVLPKGPADEAGIQVGDVVLSMGGEPLRNVRDLELQLYQYMIGNTVALELFRGDQRMTVRVTITEKDDDLERFADLVTPEKNLVAQLAILGVTIDEKIRQALMLRDNEGVLVVALSGLPAYFGDQLREGDVIHAVNRHHVASIEALRSELDQVKPGQPIVLQVERESTLNFLVLEDD